MPKNYHKILGIETNADKEQIRKAFRILAKKYHPDINNAPGADKIFIEIMEAYDVLMNRPETQKTFTETEKSEPVFDQVYWDEIRKRAEAQARMKYQKFVNQHEAFKTSGVYDVSLIFKILGRILLLPITLLLYSIPILLSFQEIKLLFLILLTWPFAIFISLYIYEKRKNYFKPGKFYYNFKRIKDHFLEINDKPDYNCFYCKGEKANSKPYKIYLLKVKDVQLDNTGPLLHRAMYKRTHKTVKIPRSQKALINHSISSMIKVICFFILPFFIPFHSFVWKMALSILFGTVLSEAFLLIRKTRSRVGYMFNRMILFKVLLWLAVMVSLTNFNTGFMNLTTYEFAVPLYFLLALFDSVFEQILKPSKSKSYKMLKSFVPYYSVLDKYFDNKYQYYLDIPLWTVIYPLFKWMLG